MFLIAVVGTHAGEGAADVQNSPPYPGVRWGMSADPGQDCQGQTQHPDSSFPKAGCTRPGTVWVCVHALPPLSQQGVHSRGVCVHICSHCTAWGHRFASEQRSATPRCTEYGGWRDKQLLQGRIKTLQLICIDFIFAVLPDHTSSHRHPAAGQEGARLSRACRVRHTSTERRKSRRHP